MQLRTKRKIYRLSSVDTAGKVVEARITLDTEIKQIVGVAIVSDNDAQVYNRGSVRLTIGAEDYFPTGTRAKSIMPTDRHRAKERYTPLEYREDLIAQPITPAARDIDFMYRDENNPSTPFQTYSLQLELMVLV